MSALMNHLRVCLPFKSGSENGIDYELENRCEIMSWIMEWNAVYSGGLTHNGDKCEGRGVGAS